MKTIYLIKLEGAKYSRAEIFLAYKLRFLKSHYTDKDSFFKYMMSPVSDKEFTRAETIRIWDAMHSVVFYDIEAGSYLTGMNSSHKLMFRPEIYRNNSNFFENYARSIIEEGEIIVLRGRPLGTKLIKKVHLSKEQDTPIQNNLPPTVSTMDTIISLGDKLSAEELKIVIKKLDQIRWDKLTDELYTDDADTPYWQK